MSQKKTNYSSDILDSKQLKSYYLYKSRNLYHEKNKQYNFQ